MEYKIRKPSNYVKPPLPGRDVWTAALRSGKYEQTTGVLECNLGQHYAYCCMGILSLLQGRLKDGYDGKTCNGANNHLVLGDDNPLHDNLDSAGKLPKGFVVVIIQDEEEISERTELAGLNDCGMPFSKIAEIIDEAWDDGGPLPQ